MRKRSAKGQLITKDSIRDLAIKRLTCDHKNIKSGECQDCGEKGERL